MYYYLCAIKPHEYTGIYDSKKGKPLVSNLNEEELNGRGVIWTKTVGVLFEPNEVLEKRDPLPDLALTNVILSSPSTTQHTHHVLLLLLSSQYSVLTPTFTHTANTLTPLSPSLLGLLHSLQLLSTPITRNFVSSLPVPHISSCIALFFFFNFFIPLLKCMVDALFCPAAGLF